jgi:hypothetical protein
MASSLPHNGAAECDTAPNFSGHGIGAPAAEPAAGPRRKGQQSACRRLEAMFLAFAFTVASINSALFILMPFLRKPSGTERNDDTTVLGAVPYASALLIQYLLVPLTSVEGQAALVPKTPPSALKRSCANVACWIVLGHTVWPLYKGPRWGFPWAAGLVLGYRIGLSVHYPEPPTPDMPRTTPNALAVRAEELASAVCRVVDAYCALALRLARAASPRHKLSDGTVARAVAALLFGAWVSLVAWWGALDEGMTLPIQLALLLMAAGAALLVAVQIILVHCLYALVEAVAP